MHLLEIAYFLSDLSPPAASWKIRQWTSVLHSLQYRLQTGGQQPIQNWCPEFSWFHLLSLKCPLLSAKGLVLSPNVTQINFVLFHLTRACQSVHCSAGLLQKGSRGQFKTGYLGLYWLHLFVNELSPFVKYCHPDPPSRVPVRAFTAVLAYCRKAAEGNSKLVTGILRKAFRLSLSKACLSMGSRIFISECRDTLYTLTVLENGIVTDHRIFWGLALANLNLKEQW